MSKLGPSVIGGEMPRHPPLFEITICCPRDEQIFQGLKIRYSLRSEALTAQCGKFYLCNIKPTTMFRRIVNFKSACKSKRVFWGKGFVERTYGVSIQIVHYKHDLFRIRILNGQQPVNLFRPIWFSSRLLSVGIPPAL